MVREPLDEKEIFNAARQILSPEARMEFLRQTCGSDSSLLHHIQVLLHAYEAQASFLEAPAAIAVAPTIDQPTSEFAGALIGPYKLIEQIGEGGMGTVWMAQQTEPVKRLVALKLIKAGMDSRQIIARFEAERQALALMDHPNIAKVLDAGTTDAGRPYFVMDLVRGVPITHYCDEHRLTPRQRLELFIPVCQAVQHAHQKGIIHRDLKPSNVLVALYDGKPVPKVIDFGVAKAAGQPLTEQTLVTGFGTIVGTLEYMSPEQAEINQLDIDTRSDIYSLGVLLYELLTGTTPLDRKRHRDTPLLDLLRIVREQDVPTLSSRLSTAVGLPTIAANRGTEPAKLTRLMRGELDWIVMKALEKDRNRRYESANGFAMDVQRHLGDEPVLACPPSVGYRLRKFVRRNKARLVIAACLLLAFMVTVGSIGWLVGDQAARTREVEGQLSLAFQETTEALEQVDWRGARLALTRAEGVLSSSGAGPVHQQRAQVLRADLEMAEVLEEIRLHRQDLNHGVFDYAGANARYVKAFAHYGIDVDGLPIDEAAARLRSRSIRVTLAAALSEWAYVRSRAGNEHQESAQRLLAIGRDADPDPFRRQIRDAFKSRDNKVLAELAAQLDVAIQPVTATHALALNLYYTGAIDLAAALLLRAHRHHPNDFWINHELGRCFMQLRPPQKEQALRFFSAAVALRPQSAAEHNNLGVALAENGLVDEAIVAFEQAIRLGPNVAIFHNNLGDRLAEKGRKQDAVAAFRKSVALDPEYLTARRNLGRILGKLGMLAQAEAEFREAIRRHPNDPSAHFSWGEFLCDTKRDHEAAVAAFRVAIKLQNDNPNVLSSLGQAEARFALGDLLVKQGKLVEAEVQLQEASRLEPDSPDPHRLLGIIRFLQNRPAEAEALFRKAIRLRPDSVKAHGTLGMALAAQRKWQEAVAAFEESIRLDPKNLRSHVELGSLLANCPEPHVRQPYRAVEVANRAIALAPKWELCWLVLGWSQYRAGNFKASIEALEKSNALQKTRQGSDPRQWCFLAMAQWQLGNKAESRRWYERAVEWMKKNNAEGEELCRFRAEAEDLLGIQKQ